MKKFFLVIVISLISINYSMSDDINEFEISGISIGDSLVQHYTQGQIETNVANKIIYPDSQFAAITMPLISGNFQFLQVTYKDKDPKYKVLSYKLVE